MQSTSLESQSRVGEDQQSEIDIGNSAMLGKHALNKIHLEIGIEGSSTKYILTNLTNQNLLCFCSNGFISIDPPIAINSWTITNHYKRWHDTTIPTPKVCEQNLFKNGYHFQVKCWINLMGT